MGAPKGNKFWKARSRHGNKPTFESPEKLWETAEDYFQWVEDNPLWEAKAFAYQGAVTVENLPKMRAMTEDGFCIFADICTATWDNYKKNKDFLEVTTRICKIIRNQKFTGAAAELLSANIIARDLGLADKREVKEVVTDSDDNPEW